MMCATCKTNAADQHHVPILGYVCHGCFVKLTLPTKVDECLSRPSIVSLCEKTTAEFDRRGDRLKTLAREVCE